MITITSKKIPDRPNNPAMIPVRNEIVHQILTYLKRQASEGDTEAETLHTEQKRGSNQHHIQRPIQNREEN